MKVKLAYGQGQLTVELPDNQTMVIEPTHRPGLANEKAAIIESLEKPIDSRPLRELIKPDHHVCIVFTDITRATPNDRIIPWLLEHLAAVPPENITLLNCLCTQRANTRAELEKMLTPEVVANYRVLNHEPENLEGCVQPGPTRDDTPALINRHL